MLNNYWTNKRESPIKRGSRASESLHMTECRGENEVSCESLLSHDRAMRNKKDNILYSFCFFVLIRRLSRRAAPLVFLFLLFSCSFDYRAAMLADEIGAGTPNAIIINLEETVVRRGVVAYRLRADRAEVFERDNLTVFTNIGFTEYTRRGEIATQGEVGHANFFSDTENMEFYDLFRIESLQQGYFITGETIFWDGRNRTLAADFDQKVTIGREDGSFIRGRGFSAGASDNSFKFEGGVEGVFVSED
ncbi:MAG: LPS export ABC transporter periplasmic protein LptC [Spirochaetes bacterium]|nr:LPS export ABC transporter periplasmic protein LptC [Spirochaetota bacterium]